MKKPQPDPTDIENRRAHPRVQLDLGKNIEVRYTRRARVFDISQGGACFFSEYPYDEGTEITLGDGVLTIQVKVLQCAQVEGEADNGAGTFRVRCQFQTVDGLAAEAFFQVVTG